MTLKNKSENTARRSAFLGFTLLGFASFGSQAIAASDCTFANLVGLDAYSNLTLTQWSEVAQDSVSMVWVHCRASKLKKELVNNPKLISRLDTLRKGYQTMRAIEGDLAGIRAGGGTMYSHAIPRMYPLIEEGIADLASLAKSPLGGQTGANYTQIINTAKADYNKYVKDLRAFKPKPEEDYGLYNAKDWGKMVDNYELQGKVIMSILGTRNDAATALGYLMLNQNTFDAIDE